MLTQFAKRRTHTLLSVALLALASCSSRDEDLMMDSNPRVGLRADAIGCWVLSTVEKNGQGASVAHPPRRVRFDTAGTTISFYARGTRTAQRLDSLGRPVIRDAEGFAVSDVWSADSTSDRIRLNFHNGLYGSSWALELPGRGTRADTMRGRWQAFDDVIPSSELPVRSAIAARVPCVAVAGAASGM